MGEPSSFSVKKIGDFRESLAAYINDWNPLGPTDWDIYGKNPDGPKFLGDS